MVQAQWNLYVACSKHEIVKRMGKMKGLGLSDSPVKNQTILWGDLTSFSHCLFKTSLHMKFNHFPGMAQICQKARLATTLQRLQKIVLGQFYFHPRTLSVKTENSFLVQESRENSCKVYIIKPPNGSRGKGIFLTRTLDFLWRDPRDTSYIHYLVQEYIERPFTIKGFKVDLRVYVLVTKVYPSLEVYVHSEGLVRFCTEKYVIPRKSNLKNTFIHLTNYSLNKHHSGFHVPVSLKDRSGSKWCFRDFFAYLKEHQYSLSQKEIEMKIDHIITKTLLSIQPGLCHEYNCVFGGRKSRFSCFELLGFDFLLDTSPKIWLLEVNCSPSLNTDSVVDNYVKSRVLCDSFDIIMGSGTPAKSGFRLAYPEAPHSRLRYEDFATVYDNILKEATPGYLRYKHTVSKKKHDLTDLQCAQKFEGKNSAQRSLRRLSSKMINEKKRIYMKQERTKTKGLESGFHDPFKMHRELKSRVGLNKLNQSSCKHVVLPLRTAKLGLENPKDCCSNMFLSKSARYLKRSKNY